MSYIGCGTVDDSIGQEEYPETPSSIQALPVFVSNTNRIELYTPRPFQTIVESSLQFNFENIYGLAEVYIFNVMPEIQNLQKGVFTGCVAGVSELAGHSEIYDNVSLGNGEESQFYSCTMQAPNVLDGNSKYFFSQLNPGIYYWFALEYNNNYFISRSSEVRMFIIE